MESNPQRKQSLSCVSPLPPRREDKTVFRKLGRIRQLRDLSQEDSRKAKKNEYQEVQAHLFLSPTFNAFQRSTKATLSIQHRPNMSCPPFPHRCHRRFPVHMQKEFARTMTGWSRQECLSRRTLRS